MPPKDQVPDGPHREFLEELFLHYREAGRPTLRVIAKWITDNQDSSDLRGTASIETVRRVLNGAVVPRSWYTVEVILQALCALADRSTDEGRWPDDNWSNSTFKGELKQRWNAALDRYEPNLPALPPRPSPPPPPFPAPRYADDPWAQSGKKPPAGSTVEDDEPPF